MTPIQVINITWPRRSDRLLPEVWTACWNFSFELVDSPRSAAKGGPGTTRPSFRRGHCRIREDGQLAEQVITAYKNLQKLSRQDEDAAAA